MAKTIIFGPNQVVDVPSKTRKIKRSVPLKWLCIERTEMFSED